MRDFTIELQLGVQLQTCDAQYHRNHYIWTRQQHVLVSRRAPVSMQELLQKHAPTDEERDQLDGAYLELLNDLEARMDNLCAATKKPLLDGVGKSDIREPIHLHFESELGAGAHKRVFKAKLLDPTAHASGSDGKPVAVTVCCSCSGATPES